MSRGLGTIPILRNIPTYLPTLGQWSRNDHVNGGTHLPTHRWWSRDHFFWPPVGGQKILDFCISLYLWKCKSWATKRIVFLLADISQLLFRKSKNQTKDWQFRIVEFYRQITFTRSITLDTWNWFCFRDWEIVVWKWMFTANHKRADNGFRKKQVREALTAVRSEN